jgi:uncharacterized membrane protein YjgN (DUF898 family)
VSELKESRFIGLGIGLAVFFILLLMPFLIVVVFYVFANVYALVRASDFHSSTMNVPIFFLGLIGTVTLFPLLAAAIAALIGRALSPRREE